MSNLARVLPLISLLLSIIVSTGCGYPVFGTPNERIAYANEQKMKEGDTALDRGDLAAARRAFESASLAAEEPTAAPRWFRLGKAYSDTGEDWAKPYARSAFYKSLKADREFPGPRFELAKLELEARNVDEALKLLRREQGIEDRPEVRELLAQVEEFVADQEHQAEERASMQARKEEGIAEERRRWKEERLARKRKLQAQSFTAGGLRCQTIDVDNIGRTYGDDTLSTTAAGTYFAVLLKCTNTLDRTRYFPWTEVVVLSPTGRSYSIDTNASFQFAASKQEDDVENPEGLQLHPDLPRYIAMMFDLPPDLAESAEVQLKFGPHRFQLNFPEDTPSDATPAAAE